MTEVLTGTQKVAVVLMNLHHDQAVAVMQQFSQAEAGEITAEIVRLRRVNSDLAGRALSEFHSAAVQGRIAAHGGRGFAIGLLEASFGAERAAGVMNRLASARSSKAFEFLDTTESGHVLTLLSGELPQTIALVLAHLRPEQAAAVMSGLGDSLRTEVAQSIATMGSATPEAVRIVADTLKRRVGAVTAPVGPIEVVGGIQPLVEIINRADAVTEKSVLETLEERDPELAEEVRARMLSFADIVRLDDRAVQQVLHGIDPSVLALAMKGSSPSVFETIRKNLSERNRLALEDEARTLGPVRVSQVADARALIVKSIRDLEARGALILQRTEEDAYVY